MSPPPPLPTFPPRIAHRGAGRRAPENTLVAFELGARLGYTAFECDVTLSADGVPFLLHDATLERTTSGSGLAVALPWAALAQLDAGAWHGAAYAGTPLLRLDALAPWLRQRGLRVNLELKPGPGDAARCARVVGAAVLALWGRAAAQQVVLSSFEPAALAAAQVAAPGVPRALLIEHDEPGWAGTADALACSGVVAHEPLINGADWVAACAARGLAVWAYTVNDAARAAELQGWGVASLITDSLPPRV